MRAGFFLFFFILTTSATAQSGPCSGHGFVDSGQALGNFPSEDVALGDFDDDGDLDAWVTNRGTQANRVWFNQGGDQGGTPGTFSDSGQALGNHDSFAVDIGDLDGDGDLDAWVANRNEPNHVWINDGFGNFTNSGQALGNSWSASVFLGDVDGDGDLDAWVANYGQANRVWFNQGGDQGGIPGTFADSGQVLGNSSSQDIILKDLDGDGDLDAWVANDNLQPNLVWINQGGDQGGTPGNYANSGQALGSSNSIGAALGDLDGDGDVDAFVANFGQANRAWINQGGIQGGIPGIFADSGQPLGGPGSFGVALGDVDGDGDLDAWVAIYGDSSGAQPNRVGLNDGSGIFADSGLALGNSPSAAVALGDLDGDGDLDAWVTNTTSVMMLNSANRVWINSIQFCNDCDGNGIPDSVEIAGDPSIDCDGNGVLDSCEGGFVDSGQDLNNFFSYGCALGDLDNDGDLDAWVANNDQPNRVLINDGSGVFSDSGQALGNYRSVNVALGDLDADGDLDAWVANNNLQPNRVWINDGTGNFSDSGQALGNSGSQNVSLGDLDGDGDLDAFVTNFSQANRIWINDGLGYFSDSGQTLGTYQSKFVALGDLDGDDDLDAWVANYNEPNRVWINDGLGNYTDSGQLLSNSNSWGVSLGDLDSDGDLDAWIANLDQPNRVWINDGIGNFSDSGQSLGGSGSLDVALGDLDCDGDLDACVANYNGQNNVWINQGGLQGGINGDYTESLHPLGYLDSWDVALGDLDGDNDLDVWVANSGMPNHVWINSNLCCTDCDGNGIQDNIEIAADPSLDCDENGIIDLCDISSDPSLDCDGNEVLDSCESIFVDSGQILGSSISEDVALGDLDGDGHLDAWVPNFGQANRIWINDGLGNYTDSGQALGNSNSLGVALGDLDGDGHLDAWVANLGQANRIWINDGLGNYTDSGQALGNSSSAKVALEDLDGDGDLDAWVANFDQPNRVWINQGGDQGGTPGTYSDSGQALSNSKSMDVALEDLDGDGDLDAWVTNYNQPNRVWINQGGDQGGFLGTFSDNGQALGNSNSNAVALGDLDSDGDLDAFVTNTFEPNCVWINQGGDQGGSLGTFADSGQALGNSSSDDVALGDLDGDGDLDAWVANNNNQQNLVWINDGLGNYTDSGQALGNSNSIGVALGDLDGDGDLDAWVANFDQPNRVWINSIQFCNDCDGNGIQDSVEISADPSLDCNTNGVLDSCDIASGFSLDSDGSGVPDECEGMRYISGDSNGDGAVDVGDGIFVLDYLFAGGASTCLDASDANGDGAVDIGDAIFVLTYLFSGGVAPAPPFPDCGEDPTTDALECESYNGC